MTIESIANTWLRARKSDISRAVELVPKALLGESTVLTPAVPQECRLIIITYELSLADMLLFKRYHFGRFVADLGGVASHKARLDCSYGSRWHARCPLNNSSTL